MWRVVWALAVVWFLCVGRPAHAEDVDWARVDVRGTRVAWTGVGLLAGSVPFALAAPLTFSGWPATFAFALGGSATPFMAGGSLRARRALVELGAPDPGRKLGVAAWALWGVGTAAVGVGALYLIAPNAYTFPGTVEAVGFGALGLGVVTVAASWGCGIAQIARNAKSRKAIPVALDAPETRPLVQVALAPRIGATSGLVVVGLF